MPLTNRAPVNAAGQIMVTGTTPTPAWPVLGGMTYDPITGELAVTSAVPNATDPWVGGLRFTNLGALYIVTTIPSPVFYVGGLPVSTLGQLFMSANPPVGSVGGWPIAGDGGVAGIGSGIGPVPIFWAPLLTTLVPTLAGNPAFTFTRATTAYVADHENILRQAVAGEARFAGARRVRNWLLKTDFSASWNFVTATPTPGVADPLGGATAITLTATASNGQMYQQQTVAGNLAVNSIWIRRRTGSGVIIFHMPSNGGNVDVTGIVTSIWRRISVAGPPGGTLLTVAVTLAISGDAVDLWGPQGELVDGQSNQAPGDYVSVGVLAAPYHGVGNTVDGIKCFATTNGNSVAANVVTESTGTLIPAATLLGFVAENAATNLFQNSQAFDGAPWGPSSVVITPDTQVAPDGTLTADVVADDAANSAHRVYQQRTLVNATVYTVSVYAKQGTLAWMQLNAQGTATVFANFNLATGALGNKSASVTSAVQILPNGWYRCSMTFTSDNVATYMLFNTVTTNQNIADAPYVGTGQTMYLWGAQVEASSDPSSYIPTTTAAVVRNVDVLQYQAATNLNGTLGTSYAECYLPTAQTANQQYALAVTTYAMQFFNSGATKGLGLYSGSFPITANGRTLGAVNKGASSWSIPNASVCLNGGAVATSPGIAAFVDTGPLYIGGTGGNLPLQGSIRNVKIYNVRIADADLVVMTQ